MAVTFVLGLFLFLSVTVVQGEEWCKVKDDNSWSGSKLEWCMYGCCGENNDRKCCSDCTDRDVCEEDKPNIVGILIGTIVGVVVLSACIVVICCCVRKNRGHKGQVIGANGNTATNNVKGGSVPMNVYSTPSNGMEYGQPMGYNNAAYPQMQAQAPPPTEQNGEQQQRTPSYDHANPN